MGDFQRLEDSVHVLNLLAGDFHHLFGVVGHNI